MKTFIGVVSLLLASMPFSGTHAQVVWIQLSGNRVVLDAVLEGVRGDSLLVNRQGRRSYIAMREIERIRVTEEGSLFIGAVAGVGVGLAAGAVLGAAAGGREDHGWNTGTTALYVGIMGGILGSVIGSADADSMVLELNGMTPVQKKESILGLLARCGTNSDAPLTVP